MGSKAKSTGPGSATGTLATTILASSLVFVDGSVFNVALPAIERGLAGDAAGLQWTINAFLLPLSALLLLGGAVGDRFGHRLALVTGVIAFGIASLGCALAPNLGSLIAARAAQGTSAALLLPSSLALLASSYEGGARGRAIGIWAAVGAATSAAGPVLGGWLVDAVGWRAIFGINLPLAGATILLAFVFVRPSEGRHGRSLDLMGALLATVGLGVATWALISGSGPGGWTPAHVGGLLIGAGLLAGFVVWERGQGDRAMIPLAMFGSRSFVGLTLLTLLLYGALGGLLVLLPYVLVVAKGMAAAEAGAALLPLAGILALLSPVFGGLAGRIGSRPLLAFGSLVAAIGFLAALRVDGDSGYWTTVAPFLALIAIGLAGAVAPLTTAVLSSVDDDFTGSASGLNSAVARTGGLVATACLGPALASRGDALVHAFHVTAIAAAAASVAAAACALLVETGSPGRAERHPSMIPGAEK